MKLKLFLGALGLYALSVALVTGLWFRFDSESDAVRSRVQELGEQHAPLPADSMKPLAEACAGKLAAGGPRTIAAYVAKLEPSKLPSLEKDYYHVDETLTGVSESYSLILSDRYLKDAAPPSLPRFQDAIDLTSWSSRLRSARAGSPELRELKYLVVARYESLTMPVVSGSTFEPGTGEYGARVLAFPSGDVLCEGRAEVSMSARVSAGGRGGTKELAQLDAASRAAELVPFVFTRSVVVAPLHELCAIGGEALCKLTIEWASPR